MITAYDMNDTQSPRIRHFLPLFTEAKPPDPETGDWAEWQALMASPEGGPEDEAEGAMAFAAESGFGTISSSLLALPDPARHGVKPKWLFAPGPPDPSAYGAVDL